MTVQSPCIRSCKLDRDTRSCTGCGRTLEEIAGWSRMSDADRQSVIDRLSVVTDLAGRELSPP